MKCTLVRVIAIVIMVGILAGIAVGVTLFVINSSSSDAQATHTFPNEFKFGAASASYQIEGAWNEDGKSPNIWDTLTHHNPSFVNDRTNGDVAANSYHFYQKDIDAIENIGFEVYRFSISWSRIIPVGSKVNEAGVAYYNKLIDGLLAKGIKPLVTIFHWDLPQYIQDLGGWTNPLIVDYFKTYADVLFERFGDRVEDWITINEPSVYCDEGYGYPISKAPAVESPGVGDYLCQHHSILASATAYRLYKEKYFAEQKGRVGICLNSGFSYAYNPSVGEDVIEKAMLFDLGRFAHPVFLTGDYPEIMINQIGEKSQIEGRPWSRLPEFTEAQKTLVKGSADFLALNYYTSRLVFPRNVENPDLVPASWSADRNIITAVKPDWPRAKSKWLYSVPEGLHDILVWIKDQYNNPTVMITENGWSDGLEIDGRGEIQDTERVEYLKAHLASVARAVNEKQCNIVAYTVWSLTDNFEWKEGFAERFGIHYIDFKSEDKTRVPKASALFFKEFMKTKSFEY